jgi:hypothetical protein
MEGELEIQGAVIEGYEETSLELQGRVEELEDRVAYQNSTIGILRGSLSDAEGQIQIYIDEVRVDAGNGRILVLIRNPSSLNAAVSCLALYTDSVSYRDYSEDATGIIPGGEAIELVWSEVDASAPSGYVDDGSDYLVMATTVTGYSDWHLYRVVEMGILVSRWRISDDEISVSIRNGNLHVPFPSVEVIGVGKVGPKGPGVLYNVTDPYLVEEGTIGGGTYTWNESAASAPENFLRYGSEFVIRVTYGAEEEWYTWDRGYSQVTVASPSVERETSGGEGGEW